MQCAIDIDVGESAGGPVEAVAPRGWLITPWARHPDPVLALVVLG